MFSYKTFARIKCMALTFRSMYRYPQLTGKAAYTIHNQYFIFSNPSECDFFAILIQNFLYHCFPWERYQERALRTQASGLEIICTYDLDKQTKQ